jgi:predicted PolB exonuclease-like 3'-5' exonuclease
LKLRAASVFNITEKGVMNCSSSKFTPPILNLNSLGYFLETTTYTDTAQAKIEDYNQREDRRTHNVGKDCIIGGR